MIYFGHKNRIKDLLLDHKAIALYICGINQN